MNESIIIQSLLVMGTTSVVIGMLLSVAAKKFKVEEDPLKEQIVLVLPGVNCGACGYPGCEQYAEAILKDSVEITLCKPGGPDVSKKIANILGKEVENLQRTVAVVLCKGGNFAKDEFIYKGIKRCDIADKYFDGQKMCKYGCLGFGDCVEVCPFDAIFIKNNVAEVDPLKCTGCGLCVRVCPNKLIKLVPCNYYVHILCSSKDKGIVVRQICSVGCIGCGICVKSCPVSDIYLEENLAIMKYTNCNNCGVCKLKCPTKSIDSKFPLEKKKEIEKFQLTIEK
ncbi:MAG: RnfABCDGE type electron transport complex subunit B [Endomicrobiia bacterium]